MTRGLSTVGLILLVTIAAEAQQPSALTPRTTHTFSAPADVAAPAAALSDVRWLEGHWTGTGLGGVCEEVWSRPTAGAMMGMFRLMKGDAVVFYEFLTLVEQNGSLMLKLKHFNADLTGWEEKAAFVTFRLLKITPNEAFFDGLTFKRVGADQLQIFLALRTDGIVREETFLFERIRPK